MWPDSSVTRVLALSVRGPRFESLLGHVMLKSKKITVFTSPAMSPAQYYLWAVATNNDDGAKCHSMRVSRHLPDNHILFDYTLHQQKLEQVQSAKYLGITITDNLDWGQQVSEISCKATKTMGFLQRNLALAPRRT